MVGLKEQSRKKIRHPDLLREGLYIEPSIEAQLKFQEKLASDPVKEPAVDLLSWGKSVDFLSSSYPHTEQTSCVIISCGGVDRCIQTSVPLLVPLHLATWFGGARLCR